MPRKLTKKNILIKKKIKDKRTELLKLMALDSNWYRQENTELYRKIMACSKEIQMLVSDKSSRIDENEYLKLRELGFTLCEISEYYGISISSLNNWRKLKHFK